MDEMFSVDDSSFKVPASKSPIPSDRIGAQAVDGTELTKSSPESPHKVTVNDHDKVLSLSELKNRALSRMSPAELLKDQTSSGVTYREPLWSGLLSEQYWIEVIKNGVVVEKFVLDKPVASVGRSKLVDVVMEHPSISRVHAVFQMRESHGTSGDEQPGLYLFDTGSTHGTFVNKNRIEANCYHRLKVGYVVKFGTSTRLFILHGPEADAPTVSPHSISEIKAINAEILRRRAETIEERKKRSEKEASEGVSWGFKEDAVESDDDEEGPGSVNPFSLPEELNLEDPKKTLKGCFEREGYEVEYLCEEQGFGNHLCRIELPMVDSEDGSPVFAEVVNKGKRKEIMVQCALEACRILDAHGILRASTHERREVKKRNWADNDFYDSDEDTYLDRTGTVEAKRKKRMEKLGVSAASETVHTFESLSADLLAAEEELSKLQHEIESSKSHVSKMNSLDTLDQYMQGVKSGGEMDANTRRKLKIKMIELKKDIAKLSKMKETARPSEIKLKAPVSETDCSKTDLNAAKNKFAIKFGIAGLKKRQQSETSQKNTESRTNSDEDINPLLRGSSSSSNSGSGQITKLVIKTNSDGTEYESDDESSNKNVDVPRQDKLENPSTNKPKESCSTSTLSTTSESGGKISLSVNTFPEPPFEPSRPNDSNKKRTKIPENPDVVNLDSIFESSERSQSGTKRKKTFKVKKADLDSALETNELCDESVSISNRSLEDDLEESESFAGWVPPADQKGDGKTKLNDKLGY